MNTWTTEAVAICRYCKKTLNGKPYYMGGNAYDPVTNKRCKVNFYGGFVCSEQCDKNASLELERTMPGHSQSYLSSFSYAHFKKNWMS